LLVYALFHVTWPFRSTLYSGDTNWTEQGHLFSWRMMLRGKTGGVRYFITDPVTKQTWLPDLRMYLNPEQAGKFPRDPELVLQLAHHFAAEQRAELGREVEVRALVLLSLNGRKPQLLIDPNVNLVHEKRGQRKRPWVMPQAEPLRYPGWDLPLLEWEKHVEIPPLEFLAEAPLVRREPAPMVNAGSR
jgi:vitamin K-dependent gamma-carboxylase